MFHLCSPWGARAELILLAGLVAGCGAEARGVTEGSSASRGPESSEGIPGVLGPRVPSTGGNSSASIPTSPSASGASTSSNPAVNIPAGPRVEPPPAPSPPPSPPAPSEPAPTAEETPAPAVVDVGECRFEYLGQWVRCENSGWPYVTHSDATDLAGCMQDCLEHADCTSVVDYFWMGRPDIGCYRYSSSCDAAEFMEDWGEEDHGREFRRSCGAPPVGGGAPDAGH
jgi:hypothetical protein